MLRSNRCRAAVHLQHCMHLRLRKPLPVLNDGSFAVKLKHVHAMTIHITFALLTAIATVILFAYLKAQTAIDLGKWTNDVLAGHWRYCSALGLRSRVVECGGFLRCIPTGYPWQCHMAACPFCAQYNAVIYSAFQFVLCSGNTLGCLRAWQFPLHFLASDTADPRCV